jgi:4-amino-4-deoxy-L-arabinose transferase-like glycosyltransferase
MNHRRDLIISCVLALLGAALFLPFLGAVHLFDWDEINFAEISREMMLTGDYFRAHINFEPFWEKPPLFFWLQSACMHVFGVHEFAARLPNALLGCITLPLLYRLGKHLYDGAFGLLWACLYAGSFLPHFYFKSGIIDPLFNLWIFLAIWFLSLWASTVAPSQPTSEQTSSNPSASSFPSSLLWAGVVAGLAVLTKGPVGFLLVALTWLSYWVCGLRNKSIHTPFPIAELPVVAAIALVISLAWYGVELWKGGLTFFREFVQYQIRLLTTGDSGHSQPLYYHFVIVLIGCFPASAFAFTAFRTSSNDSQTQHAFRVWMLCLLGVVLAVFTIVQTKIVHYSSLAYFPVTYLGAHTLHHSIKHGRALSGLAKTLLLALGVVWAVVLVAVPLIGLNKEVLMPLVRDSFAKANLQAVLEWSGWEVSIGAAYALALGVAVVLAFKQKIFEMALTLLVATPLAIVAFLAVIAPKIEGYSQRAAIEFYEGLQGKDCYVHVLSFKSYAHLFYSRLQPAQSPSGANIPTDEFESWLVEGEIDKTAYFVCKINAADEWRNKATLTELYNKNGFVFFKREPSLRRRLAHHDQWLTVFMQLPRGLLLLLHH